MLEQYWRNQLDIIDEANRRRRLNEVGGAVGRKFRFQGRDFLNFSSNNYLGLAEDPRVQSALVSGAKEWGVGSGAARLVTGSFKPFHDLEAALAEFKSTEAALVFNSGYQCNLGSLSQLLPEEGIYLSDELNHASLIDGLRLSPARCRIYPHLAVGKLEAMILEERKVHPKTPMMIVTESLFSMDGDLCPLQEILDLAEKYEVMVYLDEAHGTGVLGPGGAGLAEAYRGHPAFQNNLIQMGTLGKALGCFGAFVAGPRVLIEFLTHRARTFVYSTALPPALAVAAIEALRIVQMESGLRKKLWENISLFSKLLQRDGVGPIFPWVVGDEEKALTLMEDLKREGYWVTAIRPPTIPPGTSRLRIALSAHHSVDDLAALAEALNRNPIEQAG